MNSKQQQILDLWFEEKTIAEIALMLGLTILEVSDTLAKYYKQYPDESRQATMKARALVATKQARKLIAQIQINDASSYKVEDLLQEALKMEFQQWDLYYAYKQQLKGLCREPIMEHFEEHAEDEAEHIDLLQRYLVSMGVEPTKDRHPIPKLDKLTLESIVALQLKHELKAVELYKQILNLLGDTNNPLRVEIENIMTQEQEHAQDLQLLIEQ